MLENIGIKKNKNMTLRFGTNLGVMAKNKILEVPGIVKNEITIPDFTRLYYAALLALCSFHPVG